MVTTAVQRSAGVAKISRIAAPLPLRPASGRGRQRVAGRGAAAGEEQQQAGQDEPDRCGGEGRPHAVRLAQVDHVAGGEGPDGHAERLPGEHPGEDATTVLGGDPPQHQHRLGRGGRGDADAEDEHAGQEGDRRAGEDEVRRTGGGHDLGGDRDPHGRQPVGQPATERCGDQGPDREQARRRGGDEAAPAAGVGRVGVLVRQHRAPPDHRDRRREDQQPCALHRVLHTC